MICSSLLLAFGIYTSHMYEATPLTISERINERNDLVAVQCDNVQVSSFTNSQHLRTTTLGYDLGYDLDENFRVGIIPSFVWGYETDILPYPFGGVAYARVGMLQFNFNPEVLNVAAIFEFDLGD